MSSASSASPPAAPPQPAEPCMVYLDTCALVDIADANRPRNANALQLLSLFQQYQGSGILKLATSLWSITECHSILYEEALRRRGVQPPQYRRGPGARRNILPPDQAALADATLEKNALLHIFQTTTDFILLPDIRKDATSIFNLTMRFAEEVGVWAPDSIHLAIALDSGDCTVFVTDDRDLLDKLDSCQADFIQPYRQQQFSMLPLPLPFNGCGIDTTVSRLPGQQGRRRPSALQSLNALGFV